MGRVHNAIRRSAGEDVDSPGLSVEELESLASEPFQSEVSDPFPSEASEPLPAEPLLLREAPPSAPETFAPEPGHTLLDRFSSTLAKKIVVDRDMLPASREQYRRLAAGLHSAQQASGIKVVMIASAVSGEGKTLTASNLALTLSESYQRTVLLIDGDLRRPSLHTVFGIDDASGLGGVLFADVDRKATLHRVSARLSILPGGTPNADPMAALTSGRMRRLIESAREAFDWVIIDTPPVTVLTDAHLLSSMVDASLMVVKADETPYQLVQRSVEVLGKDRMLGVVLNRASAAADGSAYGYYNYNYGAPSS